MLSVKDVTTIYETLLSSPGMNDTVKIDLRVPRKNILFLVRVIQLGLSLRSQTPKGDLINMISNETGEELTEGTAEILRKSGLTELYDKLNSLHHE